MTRFYLLLLVLLRLTRTHIATFAEWKDIYNKTYSTTREEVLRKLVYEHNLKSSGGTILGLFGDLTQDEYRGLTDNQIRSETRKHHHLHQQTGGVSGMYCSVVHRLDGDVESTVDWRKLAVTGLIKKDSRCPGNSYVIAALGAITGQWAIKYKRKVAFSEQQVVDCIDTLWPCYFGYISDVYSYVNHNKGIATRVNYQTTGRSGTCHTTVPLGPTVTGCYTINSGDEETMRRVVGRIGPVTAVINSSQKSFKNYKGGVYYDAGCSPYSLTHHVLVVGYGRQHDKRLGKIVDYWLIKNNLGRSWGEHGYMKLRRNYYNHCGIASYVTVPTVGKYGKHVSH